MSFKSAIPPLCRYCGGPIKKRTIVVYFGSSTRRDDEFSSSRVEKPKSREEAKALLNQQIVSISYHGAGEDRYVYKVGIWDGESYERAFFCSNDHGERFGVLMARGGHCTTDYNVAKAKQADAIRESGVIA